MRHAKAMIRSNIQAHQYVILSLLQCSNDRLLIRPY